MGTPLTEDFRREMGRLAAALRHEGWRYADIADRLGLSISTCHALAYYSDWRPPEWPKVVTRVADNGCWWIVCEDVDA